MAPKAVLVGLPGSGKSTIGRRLAKELDCPMLDTDTAIEERTGRTIAEIFAADGESGFRKIEEEVVCEALREHDGVLSLGGGAITTAAIRDALVGQTVVYLEISAAEGVRRTSGSTVRPLLAGPDRAEKYRELMSQRAPLYRRVATIRINTNRRNPGAVVRSTAGRLQDPPPLRRRRPPWRRPSATAAVAEAQGGTAASDDSAGSRPVTPATLARRAGIRK